MKTQSIKFVILTIILAQSTVLFAQRKHFGNKPKNKFYFGVEGLMGTRSFKINSDITAIDKMGAFLTGTGFGAMMGDKAFHTKITRSYFNTEAMADQKFKLVETEGVVNLYPLQFMKKKFRYFEPYVVLGFNKGSLNFYGDYASQLKKNTKKATVAKAKTAPEFGTLNACACTCGGPMTDPDLYMTSPDAPAPSSAPAYSSAAPPSDPFAGDPDKEASAKPESSSAYLGKMTINRATVGGGVECHIPGATRFVNLFAEIKYGMPLSTNTGNVSFQNTKVTPQLTINFGINFGLSR
ncbi:MAG TPA: hypothetical protein VL443_26530 [Cyclobacteriaceae bacterium]|nr:hypothetical protein [Cyclobacteriaceae bacterium]